MRVASISSLRPRLHACLGLFDHRGLLLDSLVQTADEVLKILHVGRCHADLGFFLELHLIVLAILLQGIQFFLRSLVLLVELAEFFRGGIVLLLRQVNQGLQ